MKSPQWLSSLIQNTSLNLDDQSLTRSKEASRGIAESLEDERFYWIRIIKKYTGNFEGFEESWKEVIHRTPLDIVKQLALAVEEFFKSYTDKKVAPLHIVAEKGTFQLFQYVITKAKDKNPQGKLGLKWDLLNRVTTKIVTVKIAEGPSPIFDKITPLHLTAMQGNVELY